MIDPSSKSRRGDYCDDTLVSTTKIISDAKYFLEDGKCLQKYRNDDSQSPYYSGRASDQSLNMMDYAPPKNGVKDLVFSPQQLRRARCWLTNTPENKEFVKDREKVKIKYSKYRDSCKGGFHDREDAVGEIYAPPCADGFFRNPAVAASSLECKIPHGAPCDPNFSENCKSGVCKNSICASATVSNWECYYDNPVDKSVCGAAELADVFGVDLFDLFGGKCDKNSRVSLINNTFSLYI